MFIGGSRYRHAADKLQKTENVMEKYKKKLQEAADMRQQVKVQLLLCNLSVQPTDKFAGS